jgi:hypothetical protein
MQQQTKVYWMLPNESTYETTVPEVHHLLTLIKLVDTISLNAVTYHVRSSELIIDTESISVAITLQ